MEYLLGGYVQLKDIVVQRDVEELKTIPENPSVKVGV